MTNALTITDFKTSSLLSAAKTAKDNGSPTNEKTKEQLDAALTKENQVIGKLPTRELNPKKSLENQVIGKLPSRELNPKKSLPKPAVIQQANMELSNGSMAQALNTLKSAEQEAVQPQVSTETKGEPSWPEEREYDDYEDNEIETTDDTADETTNDKPSNLKWWLIGGIGGALLITAIVVIIIVAKRKK